MIKKGSLLLIWVWCVFLCSCSVTKYVPEGSCLLEEIKITSDNEQVKPSNLKIYVRQHPNSKWFSLFPVQLRVYSLSGRDSTKWVNRFLRKIGDAPVIFSSLEAERSKEEIEKAVQNMGYMGATVDYSYKLKKKKIKLKYHVHTGKPYQVKSVAYDIPDENIAEIIRNDSVHSLLKPDMIFDVNQLDAERQRLTNLLLEHGYYKFNKENFSYTADTVRNTYNVGLVLHLKPFDTLTDTKNYPQYRIGKFGFIADYDMLQSNAMGGLNVSDTLVYKDYPIYYKKRLYLRPGVMVDNLGFAPGELYSEKKVQHTYANFGRLSALRYSNIRFFEEERGDSLYLDGYVMLTKNKDKAMFFEVEGTNSAGDLGAAASVSFQHRNLFRGSEQLTVKLRGAYEAITGLQGDYSNNNYTEYGAETRLNFPNFLFPFLSSDFKRNNRATTEFGLMYNYQRRPEFSRTMASASWSYRWSQRSLQHRIDLLDIAYVYLPWISRQFKEDYIDKGQNYIFEYNYQNRLIVHTGYSLAYSFPADGIARQNTNSFSVRMRLESAGNLLYAFSKMVNMRKNADGEYSILNIPFAQYVKADLDFATKIVLDKRNTLAFHAALGVAVPYGNAKAIPFEKQYFSGGANSVRGWKVRGLGPGSFKGDGNLLNQSGDIHFDASVEFRSKLFWKLFGAVFVDAGNIWTIREYANQPGGVFRFNKFYKQIALSYGLGLRLDFDFFVLRFDGGMKALNPAYEYGPKRWPLIHPDFSRDFAFHFAVGYPF